MKISRNIVAVVLAAVVVAGVGFLIWNSREKPVASSVEALGTEIAKGVAPQIKQTEARIDELGTRVTAVENRPVPSAENTEEQLRRLALKALGEVPKGVKDNGVRLVADVQKVPLGPGCKLLGAANTGKFNTVRVWCPPHK
jgi:hypothetical protein